METNEIIPQIRPEKKKIMSNRSILNIILLILTVAVIIAVVIFFCPMKMKTRFDIDTEYYSSIDGNVIYYGDSDKDFAFMIGDPEITKELIELLGDMRGVRTFKNKETPLLYSDHLYSFNIYNSRYGNHMEMKFNGRYITVTKAGKSIKFRVVPKDIEIAVIDRLVTKGNPETKPMTSIEFTDRSDQISDYGHSPEGWVDVEWFDAHAGTHFSVTFNGFKPYSEVSFYDSDGSLVIFYTEAEGEKNEYNFFLESLPCHPHNPDARIILILNGERSYNTKFLYAIE